MRRRLSLFEASLWIAPKVLNAADAVDSALCRSPLYRLPRDVILDTLFGPLEDFEYTATTTPLSAATSRT